MLKKLIGDKAFYRMVLAVAIPIMIQNGITNFVNLLDNIMVGRIGTEQMSGVAIVNQLMMVFNVSIFGATSGAGIFGAQYAGCKDYKGLRYTFRFKWYASMALLAVGVLIFLLAGDQLILQYLHGEGITDQLDAALSYGKRYLAVMVIGLFPFALEQVYTSTLRECGETVVSMKAGIVAVLVNLVLNYLLIFGSFGFPQLGVVGAAVATVISRFLQAAIVIVWTHRHTDRMPYIVGVYRSVRIPAALIGKIMRKGTPLMINEILWSFGVAYQMQCYSVRGLSTVAAMNISSTISNLFNVVFLAMGSAISIIIGQLLGAGEKEKAKDTNTKLMAFSVGCCVILGGCLILLAPLFPRVYNTYDEVRDLATSFIRAAAAFMPLTAFVHASYFTLRSGGKTIITFLFDSAFLWCIVIPIAYVLSRYTTMPIVPLYICCLSTEAVKAVLGFVLIKKGVWINNIVHTS